MRARTRALWRRGRLGGDRRLHWPRMWRRRSLSQSILQLRFDRTVSSGRTVVRELHIQAEILLFEESDDGLQFVTIFAAHAHGVALYRCLHLALRILYRFDDILRLFGGDALLQRDLLTDAVV